MIFNSLNFSPIPLGDARVWSHATYWHGARKKMTEFAALKEAVLWLWRVHREIVPTHTEPEFHGYNFKYMFWGFQDNCVLCLV